MKNMVLLIFCFLATSLHVAATEPLQESGVITRKGADDSTSVALNINGDNLFYTVDLPNWWSPQATDIMMSTDIFITLPEVEKPNDNKWHGFRSIQMAINDDTTSFTFTLGVESATIAYSEDETYIERAADGSIIDMHSGYQAMIHKIKNVFALGGVDAVRTHVPEVVPLIDLLEKNGFKLNVLIGPNLTPEDLQSLASTDGLTMLYAAYTTYVMDGAEILARDMPDYVKFTDLFNWVHKSGYDLEQVMEAATSDKLYSGGISSYLLNAMSEVHRQRMDNLKASIEMETSTLTLSRYLKKAEQDREIVMAIIQNPYIDPQHLIRYLFSPEHDKHLFMAAIHNPQTSEDILKKCWQVWAGYKYPDGTTVAEILVDHDLLELSQEELDVLSESNEKRLSTNARFRLLSH